MPTLSFNRCDCDYLTQLTGKPTQCRNCELNDTHILPMNAVWVNQHVAYETSDTQETERLNMGRYCDANDWDERATNGELYT